MVTVAVTVLALIVLCAVLAQLLLRLLDISTPPLSGAAMPPAVYHQPQAPSYDIYRIQRARLFGEEQMAEVAEVLQPTTLDIAVDGLLVSEQPGQSLVFLTLDGEQSAYRQGEPINDDNDIIFESVSDGQVVIRYLGQLQQVPYQSRDIFLRGIEEVSAVPPEARPVEARGRLDAVRASVQDNPMILARYMSGSPLLRNGEVVGFQVSPGAEPALFRELGFQAGDVLLSVNDLSLSSQQSLPQLTRLLADTDELELKIEREGRVIRKVIRF